MTKVAANKKKTTGQPNRWPKGVSGNPAGRPKDGESWSGIIKTVGDMYPADLLEFIGKDNDLGRTLVQLPKDVQMKYLVTARVFAALMFEPTSGLWKELMERAEGKVQDKVDITTGGQPLEKVDNERFDRAISTLANAIRKSVPDEGTGSGGGVGSTE